MGSFPSSSWPLCPPQQSNQLETHLVGAFLAFAVGVGYFWVQAILTYRVTPRHGGNWIGPIRIFLCAGSTTFLVASILLSKGH